MMNLAQLDRLRYVTSHYRELQGLILAPFGLIFLVPALIPGGWGQQGETWRWLAIAAAVALSWLASLYYRRSVGRVWPSIQSGGSYRWLATLLTAALILGLLVAPWLDSRWDLPISVTFLTLAVLLVTPYVAARGRFRIHYLCLALLYSAIALLPLTGWITAAQLVKDGRLFGLLFGLAWIVAGLGDHLFLMRSLKSLPAEVADGSV